MSELPHTASRYPPENSTLLVMGCFYFSASNSNTCSIYSYYLFVKLHLDVKIVQKICPSLPESSSYYITHIALELPPRVNYISVVQTVTNFWTQILDEEACYS